MQCSKCRNEMLLDRVVEKNGAPVFYYTCINPNCNEKGKAFTAAGEQKESTIKDKE